MARIRSIKPEFAGDAKVARLSLQARLTFLLLLPEADDEGRMVASPKRLAGMLYPNDDKIGPTQVERWVQELEREEMVITYMADGTRHLAITNFKKHQSPQHPKPSPLPPPPPPGSRSHDGVMSGSCDRTEVVMTTSLLSREGVERELKGSMASAPADREKVPRSADATWDAMLAACDIHETPTASARGAYNRACRDLADVGATPAEIHRRAGIYRLKWPDASLTPSSLARHWAECSNPPLAVANGRAAPTTAVERSIRNIMEDTDDQRGSAESARGHGHVLAPTRAIEAGT